MKKKMKRQRGKGKNAELIRACKEGTLEEVCAALDDGANENAADEKKQSALMWACHREDHWDVAESIVSELLERGASCDLQTTSGDTALNLAVMYSNTGVVRLLLDAKSRVNHPNDDGMTPLIICCSERRDDEGVEIAHLLLDRGADLEHKDKKGSVAIHFACEYSSVAMVQLLLERKANVNVVGINGCTPLMHACFNHYVGEALIPILVAAGADTTLKDKDGDNVLVYAYTFGGLMMRSIASFVVPSKELRELLPSPIDCRDPIGSICEAVSYGFTHRKNNFRDQIDDKESPEYCWAILRVSPLCLDSSNNDVFKVMSESVDPKLWYYVICELGITRHPETGDTLLHVAARTGKHFAVDSMMRRGFNPFIRNTQNERPVDTVPKESVLMVEKLQAYAQFRPTVVHMEWMGPYFRKRVVAFLCVLTRWRNQGNATIIALDRNIVSCVIFRHLARMEYV
jgi:ankyrin repeat protein